MKKIRFVMIVLFFTIIFAPFLNIQEVKADGLNKEDYMIYENYYSVDYSGYKYPVLPGMSNWPYGNHQKMIDICQVSRRNLIGVGLHVPKWLVIIWDIPVVKLI